MRLSSKRLKARQKRKTASSIAFTNTANPVVINMSDTCCLCTCTVFDAHMMHASCSFFPVGTAQTLKITGPQHWVMHINLCVTSTVCWSYVFLNIWYFPTTVFSETHGFSLVICQSQPLWPVQGDPGFPKKNDEDNCFIHEENVYQQIGYRKNRGALLMWFRARLGTSHKMDSFALQKYMGWIARRLNGESARHYF